MGLADGDLFVSESILSYQQANRIYTNFRGASVPSALQPGALWSDSDDDKIYHRGASAVEEILQLTRSADVSPQFLTLRIMDTGADHYLDLKVNENLSASRLLNLVLGDAARTLTFSGNPTLGDWFDQAVKQASSPTFVAVTLSGGQVVFPASQNASANVNTLDDYEEGTFTPAMTFGGASVGITYTTQAGNYTKIGDRILYNFTIILSNKGSSNGNLFVTSLPFIAKSVTGHAPPVNLRIVRIAFVDTPQMYIRQGESNCALTEAPAGGGAETSITDAECSNTSVIYGSGSYFT